MNASQSACQRFKGSFGINFNMARIHFQKNKGSHIKVSPCMWWPNVIWKKNKNVCNRKGYSGLRFSIQFEGFASVPPS